METTQFVELVKRVGKHIKKACPLEEFKLAYAYTAVARALGFADWHELTTCLKANNWPAIQRRLNKLGSVPGDPGFAKVVQRFAESSGLPVVTSEALCAEFLSPALKTWKGGCVRNTYSTELRRAVMTHSSRTSERCPELRSFDTTTVLLAASAGPTGVRFLSQGRPVPVSVRKRRRPANALASRQCA